MTVDIKKYTPLYEQQDAYLSSLLDSLNTEVLQGRQASVNLLDEFSLQTANSTIERHENEYAVPVDPTKTIEQRRADVIQKAQAYGIINKAFIETYVETAIPGENVTVTENFSAYTFTITFTVFKGPPDNDAVIRAFIEQVKPAHLGVVYDYLYNDYDYFDTYPSLKYLDLTYYTYDELKTVTL